MDQSFHYHKSKFNPDVEGTASKTLYEGKRVKRVISYTSIKSRKTGEFHHDCTSIKTFQKAEGEWKIKPSSSITLSNDKNEELSQALAFLQACRGSDLTEAGDYIAQGDGALALEDAMQAQFDKLSLSQQQAFLQQALKKWPFERQADNVQFFESHPQAPELCNAALLGQFRRVLRQFKALIKKQSSQLGPFALAHPLLYGLGLYEDLSHLHSNSLLEEKIRFFRTAENQLLWVITAPLEIEPLFLPGALKDSWYPHPELAETLGQIQFVLDSWQNQRESWLAEHGLDPLNIKCLLIAGKHVDESQQLHAQQRYIANLNKFEIMSYEQLYQRAWRSLKAFQSQSKPLYD